ncbi:MAG TPA: hypothetical protein VFA00_04065 [Actinomycetota bacterium]|nr:hypothetical protein [Actinomycetota bacterium]
MKQTGVRLCWKSEAETHKSPELDGGGAVTGALSAVSSIFASTATLLVSFGRQVDATLSAGSVANARSSLTERKRTIRLLRAVDRTFQSVEFDRSA